MGQETQLPGPTRTPAWSLVIVAASAMVGFALLVDQAFRLSTTYDEVTYIKVAAHWWRTGEQSSITRMGSPLSFWKIQQAPTLWTLDQVGLGSWIDDPIVHQEQILPIIRIGGAWIWLVALLITAAWARKLYGHRSMALAAILFTLSPNLLAHGALATMELPLVATTSALFFSFWAFLTTRKARYFWITGTLCGLAMSCKFTTILIPPILGLLWTIDLSLQPCDPSQHWLARSLAIGRKVGLGMVALGALMVVSNLVVTGFATIPLSDRSGEHPILAGRLPARLQKWGSAVFETSFPQDWVGFATQVIHQRNGGSSYLLGERRLTGWTSYYPVALAVKVPLAFWLLFLARLAISRRGSPGDRGWVLPVILVVFLAAAMFGSKRNYGFRYLLPMASPAIVWVSAVANGGRKSRLVVVVGLAGMAASVGLSHPHELAYFNELAGGRIGGRKILADSNLDWGQGLKDLARLQRLDPKYRDLTLFYFGDIDPGCFGVEGRRIVFDANHIPAGLPAELSVETTFLAVSASLQWGPWGPEGYFKGLNSLEPVAYTDDTTIAIYRAADFRKAAAVSPPGRDLKTGRGPG
jgi:4-amino-4-deoxy-L-arabinose transferase-like glycosyltransferase